MLKLAKGAEQRFVRTNLYPKSVYTFVMEGALGQMECGYTYLRKRTRE